MEFKMIGDGFFIFEEQLKICFEYEILSFMRIDIFIWVLGGIIQYAKCYKGIFPSRNQPKINKK